MNLQGSENIFSNQVENKRSLNLHAKCIKDNQSTLACNNSHCNEYAFVCGNRNCECRMPHKKCLFTCTDQILQLIEQKRAESADVINKISQVLDKWIDEISRTRQKVEDILLNWGLSGAEKKFIEIVQNQDYKQLTGFHIHQISAETIEYFTQETKQRLFSHIKRVQQTYDAQIKSISKTVVSLFDKYQLQQKDIAFKEHLDINIETDYDFLADFKSFKMAQMSKYEGKPKKEDYDKLLEFLKEGFRKNFDGYMGKFRRNRRAYGTKKLREKYFDDYLKVVQKGHEYMKKWQHETQTHIKTINEWYKQQIMEISRYYHQSDGILEKPFTAQMALSIQKTINVIQILIEFIRTKGPEKYEILKDKDTDLTQNFDLTMYFMDEILDDHPEIDEIDAIWNVIRFEEKLKSEVNLLYDALNELRSNKYTYDLNQ